MTTLPPISPSIGKLDLAWDYDSTFPSTSKSSSTSASTSTAIPPTLHQPQPRSIPNGSHHPSYLHSHSNQISTHPHSNPGHNLDLGLGPPIHLSTPHSVSNVANSTSDMSPGLSSEKIYDEDLRIKGLTVDEVLERGTKGDVLDLRRNGSSERAQHNGDGNANANVDGIEGDGDVGISKERNVIADSQFRPPPEEFINPFHRLSHPEPVPNHTYDPDLNNAHGNGHVQTSMPLPPAHKKHLSKIERTANDQTLAQLERAAYASTLTRPPSSSPDGPVVVPTVHIKKVGRDSVQIVAQDPGVDGMVRLTSANGDGWVGRRASNGSLRSGRQAPLQNGHAETNGFVKRVFTGKKRSSRKGNNGSAQQQQRRVEPNPDEEEHGFRPSDADEQGMAPSGPAPLSPPISVEDNESTSGGEDSESDSDSDSDDETSADSEDGYDDPGLRGSMGDLQRQVSISGQNFVEEPMSIDQAASSGTAVPLGTRSGRDRDGSVETIMEGVNGLGTGTGTGTDSAPSTGHLPSSATFGGAERTSLDRIAAGAPSGSGGAFSAISHRSGPIRAGSIAASKARTGGAGTTGTGTGTSGVNVLGPGSGPVLRVPSPTQRQVEMGLDSKEPPIPSAAEQAPINTGAVPLPMASANQAPPPAHGVVPQGAGGSYFPQPVNAQTATYLDGMLHPSSASFMSTASAGSSSQQHAGPSSHAGHRMERRNTSGSMQAMQSVRTPIGQPQGSFAWDQQPSLASPRRASQTEVPGLQGSALDPDILAEAEKLRRERLSKRQRKRSSGDETATILGGSPEPPFATGFETGPSRGQTASPVMHTEPESAVAVRTSMQQQAVPITGHQQAETQPVVLNDGSAFVGNLIGEDHVNYVLMYNMLTGIRIGVSRCQAKMKRPLTPEDFTAKHKYSFDIVGNELTPSARYDFKFKDYAPWVFRELREDYFHLDPADYLLSLTAKYILSELGSPGKSGSFFYFSRDYRFIIKTIHHAEHKYLRSILKDYHAHIKNNPHTLMSRFYGLHRVKLPRGRKIHFVIMNNLFPPHRDIHETYDLKGSAVGREYPEEKAKINPKATLKDLNWFHRGRMFELGPEKRALFGEQLRRDRDFLCHIGVMDYSLLIGIHNMERGNKDNIREGQLSVFQPNVNTAMRRKPSSIKGGSDAAAMRKAVRRSDPKALTSAVAELPTSDSADRRHFLFYQDEGGLRATDEANDAMDIIYYLGVIDILTPYNTTKKLEHLWRSLTEKDRHMVSCVPPDEYGERFLAFLISFFRDADVSKRPRMELKTKTE